jgi:hypothetical protein
LVDKIENFDILTLEEDKDMVCNYIFELFIGGRIE